MRSKLAIWSFVLSLLGPFLYLLAIFTPLSIFNSAWAALIIFIGLPISGFITSIISLIIIKKNNLKGKGFAIASLIISVLILLLILFLMFRTVNY